MTTSFDLPQNVTMTRAYTASAAVTLNRFVNITGTLTVGLPALGGRAIGVAQNDAALGERVTVKHSGPASVEASGLIGVGANVSTDALGRAKVALATEDILGVAAQAALVAGDVILVEIYAIGKDSVAGSGTLNTLVQWTPDGMTLGDSAVSQEGASPANSWHVEANGDFRFNFGSAHRFFIRTHPTVPASVDEITLAGQDGAPGTLVLPGNDGGDIFILGAAGGAGTVATLAGAGSDITVLSGDGGADGGFGGAGSGDIDVDVGTPTLGPAGSLRIGTTTGGGAVPTLLALGLFNGGPPTTILGTSITLGHESATVATVEDAAALIRQTTGVPVAGFGTGLRYVAENSVGATEDAARVAAVLFDPVAISYTTRLQWSTRFDGVALVVRMQLGTGLAVGSLTNPGAGRIAMRGDDLVAADVVRDAGWGGAGAATAVAGDDSHWTITITAGAVPAANPTFTLTFHDGSWGTAPFAMVKMGAGTTNPADLVIPVTETTTLTTVVVTFHGLPVAGQDYQFKGLIFGRGV